MSQHALLVLSISYGVRVCLLWYTVLCPSWGQAGSQAYAPYPPDGYAVAWLPDLGIMTSCRINGTRFLVWSAFLAALPPAPIARLALTLVTRALLYCTLAPQVPIPKVHTYWHDQAF